MRVLGVVGSLRPDSHNLRLLRAAADELPPGVELVVFEELKAVEPFDETDEHETGGGMPGADAFIAAIRDADAVLFATPEYNGSIPGVLKNAIDWASRPTPAPPPPAGGQAGRRDRREHRLVRRRLGPGGTAQGPWPGGRSRPRPRTRGADRPRGIHGGRTTDARRVQAATAADFR